MLHFTKLSFFLFLSTSLFAQSQKRPLNASDYDRWQSVKSEKISNDGHWIAYQIDPQEGDGRLEVSTGFSPSATGGPRYSFPRGYMAQFTPDSKFLVMRLKVPVADTHKAKLKKKKADDLPKDSLLVLDMATGKTVRMPNVKSFAFGKDAGAWLAILQQPKDEKEKPAAKVAAGSGKDTLNPIAPVSTTTIVTKKGPAKKIKGDDLTLMNMADGSRRTVRYVSDMAMSDNGQAVFYSRESAIDTLKTGRVLRPACFYSTSRTGKRCWWTATQPAKFIKD